MKACTKCGGSFPLDEFYRDKSTRDGLGCWCKECVKKRSRAWQDANREHVLAQKKEYYQRPGKHELNYVNVRKAMERHPGKVAAREKLKSAIRHGKLIRQPCEKCSKPKAQGHHYDYTRPLDVRWLCTRCHGEEHRHENAAKRAVQ